MVPEKQGLKQPYAWSLKVGGEGLSSGSRKTRIETPKGNRLSRITRSLSSGSRKTRIETQGICVDADYVYGLSSGSRKTRIETRDDINCPDGA